MFTGKNKEQFEKWLKIEVKKHYHFMQIENVIGFKILPFSIQLGIYLEYLDSVGIHIESKCWIDKTEDVNLTYYYCNWCSINHPKEEDGSDYPTRQEALTEAFKKADELINKMK
jgi:hypothetical protein